MKQQSNKHQEYTYAAQTVHAVNQSSVLYSPQGEAGFWVQPPEEAISMEYLFVDIKIRFNDNIPLDDCRITRIGVLSYSPDLGFYESQAKRFIDVDLQADANRELVIQRNLSFLLDKSKVDPDISTGNNNVPFVNYPEEATYIDNSGTFPVTYPPAFLWWKNDQMFTVRGQV